MKKMFKSILLASCLCGVLFTTGCASQKDIDNAVSPVTEQITTINSTLTDLKALDTVVEGKITSLESKVATFETELEALETSINTKLNQTKTELENKINTLKEDIDLLKEKDIALEAKIVELEETLNLKVGQMQSWVTNNYATIDSCEALETEIKALISALETRVEALETSVETLEASLSALQEKVNEHEKEIDDLTIRVNCLEGKHVWVEGVCEHCKVVCEHTEFTFIDNGNGTHKKDCVCDHDEDLNHTLVYAADDEANTITESCSDGCGYSSTITLKAPTGSLIYNGNRQDATVEGIIIGDYQITYNDEPIYVASYVATLTIDNVSISVEYSIIQDPATGGFDGEWVAF